ncbi:MAG: Holliday junction resolvase RuvX [Nitrospira sp.]|nr:Holliday junction resolvase RuvX [Nitrospira sp.]MDR4463917.1 Holliday junction resolvase RuvX [Nitrospira sp.]MDR4469084.1 Holliday junction resolvase RuvX [Nitrospira sp.]
MPGRILALDYGTKRIGVALSDELKWTAQPLETFERRALEWDIAHVAGLVTAHDVERVVLGFPLQLDGREGPAVLAMRAFAEKLEAGISVPIVLWDERMTTKAAEDLLIAADVSRKKRKGVVDRIAAAILLQSYLEAQSSSSTANQTNTGVDGMEQPWVTEGAGNQSHDVTRTSDRNHRRRRARRNGRLSDDAMG